MHVCKGGWAGQAFALATSNESGGKKSRIRRSKEERKSMVESFIKKYQKSNNGNFPSLNLTHKEVGGSFYTVREIVREIIQENRVLAPPKVLLEENGHSEYLEQHPLGSISMDPQIHLSVSDGVHMVTHILPSEYQISSEESIYSFKGSYPLELDNEQIIDGVSKVADKDKGSDGTCNSHDAPNPNHYQDTSVGDISNSIEESPLTKGHKFEDEKIVNGLEVPDGSSHCDKPLRTNFDNQDNIDGAPISSENFDELGSQRIGNEQEHNMNDRMNDKTNDFERRVCTEPALMEALEGEKLGAKNIETSQTIKSPMDSDVVVETFPLRPVPRTIHNVNEEYGKPQDAARKLEEKETQHNVKTFAQSSSGFVNEKGKEKLPDLTMELKGESRDEKVVLNLQPLSPENATYPSASKSILLVKELEPMVSSPDATKASSCTETVISEDSIAVGGKSCDQDNSRSSKGNNPTLARINLETWEGPSKKSSRLESNPLLALVKAFISSFVKFWSE